MGDSSISLWFDLNITTGMADADLGTQPGQPKTGKGMTVHSIPIASLIIENVYFGNFDKNWGADAMMGFWEWTPKVSSGSVSTFPLPAEWKKTVRGGWHWEISKIPSRFVALAQDKPFGKKIGAMDGFKVEDFRGYYQRGPWGGEGAWKFAGDHGFWVINDGKFRVSGRWNFLNLIKR